MRTLAVLLCSAAVAVPFHAAAAPKAGVGAGSPDRAAALHMVQSAGPADRPMGADMAPNALEKSASKNATNGLYMSGQFAYLFANGTVTVTLDQINNTSSNTTTGTLRLSLWATTTQPARYQGFTGYRLANFATFDPLPPNNYYYGITRSAAFIAPPNGTYWIVLSLDQYNPSGCPTSGDGYCTEDTFVSYSQETWGPVVTASPASLENPAPGSYQSGIGLISGWSCQGPVSVSIDGVANAILYGGSRGDTASACNGATNNGFGLLINYNNLGAGAHTAQLYVNGLPSGTPRTFYVTVPSGEFMTGLSRSIQVPNFPSNGRTTTLTWQESQQNFAIQSVAP
jgi:hypothetical protein